MPFGGVNLSKYSTTNKAKYTKKLAEAIKEATETPEVLQCDFSAFQVESSESESESIHEPGTKEVDEEQSKVKKTKPAVPKKRKAEVLEGGAKKLIKKEPAEVKPLFKKVPEKMEADQMLSLRHKLQRILLGKQVLTAEFLRAKQIFEQLNKVEPEIEMLKSTKILKALRMIGELRLDDDPYSLVQCSVDLQESWKQQLMRQTVQNTAPNQHEISKQEDFVQDQE